MKRTSPVAAALTVFSLAAIGGCGDGDGASIDDIPRSQLFTDICVVLGDEEPSDSLKELLEVRESEPAAVCMASERVAVEQGWEHEFEYPVWAALDNDGELQLEGEHGAAIEAFELAGYSEGDFDCSYWEDGFIMGPDGDFVTVEGLVNVMCLVDDGRGDDGGDMTTVP